MSQEFEDVSKQELLFRFATKDTAVIHELQLLSNGNDEPLLFYSDIETPVCADGECKLANLKVYWNLLGNYVGFGVHDKIPLTKNEHDPFTHDDYKKLHQLLGDRHSVLERREMDELIDKVPVTGEALKTYKGIDAISGATKKEIKESVVKGGLYSCYTLWHLVQGEVVDGMKSYLKSIYSNDLTNYFLESPYKDYQEYGLKKLPQEDYEAHFEEVIKIYRTTSPITRAYILKKIPKELFQKESVTFQFYNTFDNVDSNTRTQLLRKMLNSATISAELVVSQIDVMTKNQLQIYLSFLQEHPVFFTETMKKELKKYTRSKGGKYTIEVKQFIKEV